MHVSRAVLGYATTRILTTPLMQFKALAPKVEL